MRRSDCVLAVEPYREDRERMHGLVEPQAFHIRPLEDIGALLRELADVVQRVELDEARVRSRLDPFDHVSERN